MPGPPRREALGGGALLLACRQRVSSGCRCGQRDVQVSKNFCYSCASTFVLARITQMFANTSIVEKELSFRTNEPRPRRHEKLFSLSVR